MYRFQYISHSAPHFSRKQAWVAALNQLSLFYVKIQKKISLDKEGNFVSANLIESKSFRVIFTAFLAFLGGYAFDSLGIYLPWMLGPLFVVMIAKVKLRKYLFWSTYFEQCSRQSFGHIYTPILTHKLHVQQFEGISNIN